MPYIGVSIETDPYELAADAITRLAENIPGWVPREGHLEVWMIETLARLVAEAADVASRVPDTIFRHFGETLLSLPPIMAAAASAETTWTMIDAQGYTIPAGTAVGFRTAGDELVAFRTVDKIVIDPGINSADGVVIRAIDDGSEPNGLGPGGIELIDALAFVDTVTATTQATAGVDAESDEAYLDRLTQELQLLTPRPILPDDFSTLARRTQGVYRARTIDGYDPGEYEVQSVIVSADATGGTFTLTYDASTTAGIAFNASDADVQAALEALANIAVGDIDVTGGFVNDADGVQVRFTSLGDKAEMVPDGTGLTPAGAIVDVVTDTPGRPQTSDNARMVTVVAVDQGGYPLTQNAQDQLIADLEAMREVNFIVHVADPEYMSVHVAYEVIAEPGYDPALVEASVDEALMDYLSPMNFAGGRLSPPRWELATHVRYSALIAQIIVVPGVAYVASLTINGMNDDLALPNSFTLPAHFDDLVDPSTVTGVAQAGG